MIVILMKDVKGSGKAGDVVKVSDGYARNMLLPKGLAKEATEGNIRSLEKQKAIAAEKLEEQRESQISYMWEEYEITPNNALSYRNETMTDSLVIRQDVKNNLKDRIQGRGFRQAVRIHHFQGYCGSTGKTGRHEDRQEKD